MGISHCRCSWYRLVVRPLSVCQHRLGPSYENTVAVNIVYYNSCIENSDTVCYVVLMISEQARMARAALSLGMRDVAAGTGLSTATITRIEKGGDARVSTLRTLQGYYEAQGIVFVDADQSAGPGVRIDL